MATTNTLQISGFNQIQYRIFILPPAHPKSTPSPSAVSSDLRRVQITLLRRGELANVKNGELWTFGRDGIQAAPVPEENSNLQEISTGTLFASQLLTLDETPPQNATAQNLRNEVAHDQFLSAVRALVEFRFLQLSGYHILGSWIIPPSSDDFNNESFRSLLPALQSSSSRRDAFKINVNLTSNGDLYITPERHILFLQPLRPAQLPSEGTQILLSPSGETAEFLSLPASNSQSSSILQKIRTVTALEAKLPLLRIRLSSGVETLWPVNLCFRHPAPRKSNLVDNTDYFNMKDGVSSAVKLISEALVYKPPPAPSPAIPPTVAAHVTPSGIYHTPPDGITRSKPAPATAPTPNVNSTVQEDWAVPAKEEDFWTSMNEPLNEEEDFSFGGMEEGFDVREEDFNFFDDEPSGEFDVGETTIQETNHSEEQTLPASEEQTMPMEDVQVEKPQTPVTVLEASMVLSPPSSPLRILPSPPPTRRGSFPKVWDHVRLSGNLDKVQEKYKRGGKYWCEIMDDELSDDLSDSDSSEDELVDMDKVNPRKRKRDDDESGEGYQVSGSGHGQQLEPDTIASVIRSIEENHLLLQSSSNRLMNSRQLSEKVIDFANGLDDTNFNALVEIISTQVAWDGLDQGNDSENTKEMPLDDFISVVSGIWGVDTPNNPGLKELTEALDAPTSTEDSPQLKPPRMKPTKSSHTPASSFSLISNLEQTQSIYPISPPSFLVHRILNRNPPAPNQVQRLSVSPPALRFWEKLSLSPVAGEKDVICYVVYPESEGMGSSVDMFLSELQTTWEACSMGKFERGVVKEGEKLGMIPVNVSQGADEDMCLAGYKDALVNFGRGLPNTWLTNILILMVNPFSSSSAVISLCKAFLSFKSAYAEVLDNPALIPSSNVALQIVPVDLVARKEGVVMRGLEFHSFLRVLYDRCEVMENTVSTNPKPASRARDFLVSPATVIASPPPANLEFTEFSATSPSQHRSLLKDNSSLHIAYTISPDANWASAVWTDDWGQLSLKESFCLTRLGEKSSTKNQPSQYLETICSKIWHRTVDIAKQARISWKIIIVRVGGMTKNELSIWNNLKQSTSSEFAGRVQLVLACIDFNPALALSVQSMQTAAASPFAMSSTPFTSSVATFSQSSPAAVGNAYGTPVATPLAIANESPDPSGGLMSTPTGNADAANNDYDPEVRWVDAMDEVWGIVLNHRVPACRNDDGEQDVRLALASGYLWPVKSVLPHNLVQVHLLHIDKPHSVSSPPPETLPPNYVKDALKQLLAQYRGLASLGAIRSVSYQDKIVPWHAVAAERIKEVFTGIL